MIRSTTEKQEIMTLIVHCPRCKKPVVWDESSPFRPFCSKRCRVIDLGAWADGSYKIPTTEVPEDIDLENPPEDQENPPEDQDKHDDS